MADAAANDWRPIRSVIPDRCTLEVSDSARREVWPAHAQPHSHDSVSAIQPLNLGYCDANPIRAQRLRAACVNRDGTARYTLEEGENTINAPVDGTDAQLLFALCFFMGCVRQRRSRFSRTTSMPKP